MSSPTVDRLLSDLAAQPFAVLLDAQAITPTISTAAISLRIGDADAIRLPPLTRPELLRLEETIRLYLATGRDQLTALNL